MFYPKQIFFISIVVGVLSLFWDGTARTWVRLKSRESGLVDSIKKSGQQVSALERKIKKAHDPRYLEQEARERFDLVREGDLVFVFSE